MCVGFCPDLCWALYFLRSVLTPLCVFIIWWVCFLWVHSSSELVSISKYQTPIFHKTCDLQPCFVLLSPKKCFLAHSSHGWFIYALDDHPNHQNIVIAAIVPQSQRVEYFSQKGPLDQNSTCVRLLSQFERIQMAASAWSSTEAILDQFSVCK